MAQVLFSITLTIAILGAVVVGELALLDYITDAIGPLLGG